MSSEQLTVNQVSVKDSAETVETKKFVRWRYVGYVFCVLFLAWIVIAPLLANFLIVERPLERVDAIWVLGGSSTYRERTHKAAEIYKKGIAPKIFVVNDGVFGGWNKTEQRNPPFSEISRRELIAQGVPADAIEILPELVEGTSDEAELLARTEQTRELRSVLLVTSAYHSRRTLWTFDRSKIKNNLSLEIGLEHCPPAEQTPPAATWWLSRKGWAMVGGEYVKMLYYWFSY